MTVLIILLIIFIIWVFSGSNTTKTNNTKNKNAIYDYNRKLESTRKEEEIARERQIRIEKENKIKSVHNRDKIKEVILDKYGIEYFYHMTHKNNLKGILEKGLYSHNYAHSKGLTKRDIANIDVVNRRSLRTDTINRLSINDYAPLYFNPKNPMLYVKRNIENDLVIIAFDRSVIYHQNSIFTDGNAANNSTKFYNSLNDLNKLNWDCLNAEYWNDFQDGKRQRMAEVLVKGKIPNTKIRKLFCNNRSTLNFVNRLIEDYNYITAELRPTLFFNNGSGPTFKSLNDLLF